MRTLLFRYDIAVWHVTEAMQLKLFQMACADMILLSKVDLAGRERIGKIKAWLDERFRRYRLIEATHYTRAVRDG
jgi:G3E family GTPase